MSHLVASVVADGADIDVEGGADHLAVRVLQHVGGVHRLGLVVVLKYQDRPSHSQQPNTPYLAEDAVGRQFLCLLHFLLGLKFKSWRNVFKSAG